MIVLALLSKCRRCRWAYAIHAGLCHYCEAHMSRAIESTRKPRRRQLQAGDEVRRSNGQRAVVLDRSSAELVLRESHPSRRSDEWVVVVFISGYLAYSQKRRGRRPALRLGGRGTTVVTVLRLTLWLHAGGELADYDGLEACHGPCENLACVNPWHAYWGTADENREDRVARTGGYFGRKASDLQVGVER